MSARLESVEAPAWVGDAPPPRLIVRGDKRDVDYLPSWDWGADYLGDEHARALEDVSEIDGMMYTQDALKLFELAWFTPGPILEIGTYRGRSSTIMARALGLSGNPAPIVSLDIDAAALEIARDNLQRCGVAERVTLVEGTVSELLAEMPDLRPGLVFVDGDHTYRGVKQDLRSLRDRVPDGCVIVMHDFEGYEADDPYWVRVREAAEDSWLARDAVFCGRFGLSGVYWRRGGAPFAPGGGPQASRSILRLRKTPGPLGRRLGSLRQRLDRRLFHLRRRGTYAPD